jgi:hypothetical protein
VTVLAKAKAVTMSEFNLKSYFFALLLKALNVANTNHILLDNNL